MCSESTDLYLTMDSFDEKPKHSANIEFINLNDDCLIAILRYLGVDDLNSIASTCTHLKGLARIVFHLKPANKCFSIRQMIQRHEENAEEEITRYLENFGSMITEITFDICNNTSLWEQFAPIAHFNDPIFEHIMAHCSDGKLESLRLGTIYLSSEVAVRGHQLFSHLRQFQLKYCENLSEILPWCHNCEKLTIQGAISVVDLDTHFPALYDFTLKYDQAYAIRAFNGEVASISPALETFLRRHDRLTALELCTPNDMDFMVIGELEQLKRLHLYGAIVQMRDDEAAPFHLPHLNRVILDYDDRNVSKFMHKLATTATRDSLEYLKIANCQVGNGFVSDLANFKKLRILKFIGIKDFTTNGMAGLQQLQSLTKFVMDYFDANTVRHLANLGSVDSLQSLKINYCPINNEFFEGICRFRQLRVLKLLEPEIGDFSEEHLALLRHLNQLTKLFVDYDHPNIKVFLNHFGSMESLKYLRTSHCPIDVDFFVSVCRFSHLQTLELMYIQDLTDNLLQHLEMLDELDGFNVLVLTGCRLLTWNGLINLIEKLKKLKLLKVIDLCDGTGLSLMDYDKLVYICRQQNRKIIIEMYQWTRFDASKYLNCDLVEIQQKYMLDFL